MIITRIIGGLGNQMFQYAAGKTLAHLNNTALKLDVTSFEEYKLRDFDLFNFTASIDFATQQEIDNLLPAHNFEKAFQYLSPLRKRTYYREKYFHFDERFLKLGDNVFLKGYFQSEKYFLPAKEIIRKDLTCKESSVKNVREFSNRLNEKNSVSIHVRRGDYEKDPAIAERHGALPAGYYRQAIELIKTKILTPVFYIFSDDMEWVKEHLQISQAVCVTNEITKDPIEDLYLMSKCRHNIIANSSFSWWGAWLNDDPGKIVVAPKKWFNKGPGDVQDIIPAGWYKI